jgi:hypothetical protein
MLPLNDAKEWEERGETTIPTIQTISKQHIVGAMVKKDQAGWKTDGPSPRAGRTGMKLEYF